VPIHPDHPDHPDREGENGRFWPASPWPRP